MITTCWYLHQGAPVDMVDREHRSPLLLAAAQGGWRSVEILLAQGADPGIRDTSEKNLLHVVIMNGGSLSNLLQIRNSTKTWVGVVWQVRDVAHDRKKGRCQCVSKSDY